MKIETGIARKIWPCNFADCRKKIGKGEEYLLWHIAGGMAQRQHQAHGQPVKPATKKTAAKVTKKKAATKKVAKKATKKGKGGKK